MLKVILLFLPFTMGSININVNPPTKFSKGTVDITGFEESRTTNTELETFKITEQIISYNLQRHITRAPDYMLVLNADVYGYKPLKTLIVPFKATIIHHDTKNVSVTVKEFHNNSSAPIGVKVGIKEEVLETLSTTWSSSGELSIARDITLKYGSNSYSYKSKWGQEVYKSKTKILTTTSDPELTLKPGQRFKAILSATKGTLSLKVDYRASVHGDIYLRYTLFSIPFYTRGLDINTYLYMVNQPHSITSSEIISVDYYDDAQVIIKDIESDKNLLVEPVLLL